MGRFLFSSVSSFKVSGAKGCVKVAWKAARGANAGYQLRWSTKKSMGGAKAVKVKKGTVSYVIRGLKRGQRVYVQVCPLAKSGGKSCAGLKSAKRDAKVR